jgi:hypothetical protein
MLYHDLVAQANAFQRYTAAAGRSGAGLEDNSIQIPGVQNWCARELLPEPSHFLCMNSYDYKLERTIAFQSVFTCRRTTETLSILPWPTSLWKNGFWCAAAWRSSNQGRWKQAKVTISHPSDAAQDMLQSLTSPLHKSVLRKLLFIYLFRELALRLSSPGSLRRQMHGARSVTSSPQAVFGQQHLLSILVGEGKR